MLTTDQLAAALGFAGGASFSAAERGNIDRIREASEALIERYAPAAPDAVKNEAQVRLAGWLLDAPAAVASRSNGLQASGAGAILSLYRERRAGVVRGEPEAPGPELTQEAVEALGFLVAAAIDQRIAEARVANPPTQAEIIGLGFNTATETAAARDLAIAQAIANIPDPPPSGPTAAEVAGQIDGVQGAFVIRPGRIAGTTQQVQVAFTRPASFIGPDARTYTVQSFTMDQNNVVRITFTANVPEAILEGMRIVLASTDGARRIEVVPSVSGASNRVVAVVGGPRLTALFNAGRQVLMYIRQYVTLDQVPAAPATWAEDGNDDPIPAPKLPETMTGPANRGFTFSVVPSQDGIPSQIGIAPLTAAAPAGTVIVDNDGNRYPVMSMRQIAGPNLAQSRLMLILGTMDSPDAPDLTGREIDAQQQALNVQHTIVQSDVSQGILSGEIIYSVDFAQAPGFDTSSGEPISVNMTAGAPPRVNWSGFRWRFLNASAGNAMNGAFSAAPEATRDLEEGGASAREAVARIRQYRFVVATATGLANQGGETGGHQRQDVSAIRGWDRGGATWEGNITVAGYNAFLRVSRTGTVSLTLQGGSPTPVATGTNIELQFAETI